MLHVRTNDWHAVLVFNLALNSALARDGEWWVVIIRRQSCDAIDNTARLAILLLMGAASGYR